jgi:alkylation response protein AidB-like acyl-CoA dehydrogenase
VSALLNARALAPSIAARAAEMEAVRRLPADLAADMASAGLFRIALPKGLGGDELPPAGIVEVIEAVAEGDASAGWCLMIGSTTTVSLAWLPRPVSQAVAATPGLITGGVFAPLGRADRENGHYRVSGRWSWASGSANCQWLFGGCVIREGGSPRLRPDGRPETRMVLMPAAEVELIDTWHAAGLKGTGSGDMAVHDLLVPHERSVDIAFDPPVEQGALYLFPVFGLLALGIAGAASGNARPPAAGQQPLGSRARDRAGRDRPGRSQAVGGARAAVRDDGTGMGCSRCRRRGHARDARAAAAGGHPHGADGSRGHPHRL